MTSLALAVLAGLAFGLSLIVAIGAQNAFVLRQGLRREHVLAVVLVCALSDAVLIGAGVLGLGALLSLAPWLETVMRFAGAAFLLGYGLRAAYRAWRPKDGGGLESGTAPATSRGRSPLWAAVGTCLALTWLNPHVYLDTVVLLGSVAGSYGDLRWWFGAGAATGSILWFAALGYGARFLRPLFARPLSWRILDGVIAVIMIAIAASLVMGAL